MTEGCTFSFLSRGIIVWIELPLPENPANTCARHMETLLTRPNKVETAVQCFCITEGMELPNQEKFLLDEKENYKYLGMLEADTIKPVEMKKKKKIKKSISEERESYSKHKNIVETL